MNLGRFFLIDVETEKMLVLSVSILLFFTVLFHVWRKIRNSPLVEEMLLRTYSWWAIFLLYLVFFCIRREFGHVGWTLLGLLALREFMAKFSDDVFPKGLKVLCQILAVVQFTWAFLGQQVAVAAFLPFFGLFALAVYSILRGSVEQLKAGVPVAIWGLLTTVYGLSHLSLLIEMSNRVPGVTSPSALFMFYLFLTQFNDVLQFIWGKSFGRHPVSTAISPKKTWEGVVGAAVTTMLIGGFLIRDITPFSVVEGMVIAGMLSITGFAGDIYFSAIKRSLKLKDMGDLIPGHGGVLDRIDSLTFSSLFYFYTIYFWMMVES